MSSYCTQNVHRTFPDSPRCTLAHSFPPTGSTCDTLWVRADPIVGPDLFKIHPYPTPFPAEEEKGHTYRLTTFMARLTDKREFAASWDHDIKEPFDFHAPQPDRDRFLYDPDLEECRREMITPFHPNNPCLH